MEEQSALGQVGGLTSSLMRRDNNASCMASLYETMDPVVNKKEKTVVSAPSVTPLTLISFSLFWLEKNLQPYVNIEILLHAGRKAPEFPPDLPFSMRNQRRLLKKKRQCADGDIGKAVRTQ